MTQTRRILCWFYALVALAALVATWSQNIAHFQAGRTFLDYIDDLTLTASSRSFSVDLGFLLLAGVALMVAEARRLAMGWTVWLYVALSFVIAISVTFPLFLIARELRLAKAGPVDGGVKLTASDVIGLAVVTAVVLAMSYYILF